MREPAEMDEVPSDASDFLEHRREKRRSDIRTDESPAFGKLRSIHAVWLGILLILVGIVIGLYDLIYFGFLMLVVSFVIHRRRTKATPIFFRKHDKRGSG